MTQYTYPVKVRRVHGLDVDYAEAVRLGLLAFQEGGMRLPHGPHLLPEATAEAISVNLDHYARMALETVRADLHEPGHYIPSVIDTATYLCILHAVIEGLLP